MLTIWRYRYVLGLVEHVSVDRDFLKQVWPAASISVRQHVNLFQQVFLWDDNNNNSNNNNDNIYFLKPKTIVLKCAIRDLHNLLSAHLEITAPVGWALNTNN